MEIHIIKVCILYIILSICYVVLGLPKSIKELKHSIYDDYSRKDSVSLFDIIWFIFVTVLFIMLCIYMSIGYILLKRITFKSHNKN